jgi:FkbM family methyltransferase
MSGLASTLKTAIRRLGIDVVRFPRRDRVPLASFLQRFNIDLVLDVGGNIGQYGEWLRSLGYRGQIISFEPNPEPFAQLRARAKADGSWECHNVGIGAVAGQAILNVSDLDVYSSMLPQTSYLRQLDPRSTANRQLTVPVISLDEFIRKHPVTGKMLLKIDTQGHERPVIEGASELLRHVTGVQLELSLTSLYESQPSLEEMIARLRSAGFAPYAFWEGFTDPDTGATLEMDGLFYAR